MARLGQSHAVVFRDRHGLPATPVSVFSVQRAAGHVVAPLLDKEGLGEVLSRVKNPPQSPLRMGGR